MEGAIIVIIVIIFIIMSVALSAQVSEAALTVLVAQTNTDHTLGFWS